jgi:hypothetical protein
MNMLVEPFVADMPDVTDTSTLPDPGTEPGTFTVTAGPRLAGLRTVV